MKAIDIQTNTEHDVISINYDTNCVVLQSKEYGRTSNTIENVRLLMDEDEDLKGKTIIYPEAFWMIPLLGWFIVPYKLFTVKNSIILSDKFSHHVYMWIAGFGPIILFILLMILSLTLRGL